MSTILILAMALSVTAPSGSRMNALENLLPSPVWLESLYGPPETIPTGMPTDCHAVWAQTPEFEPTNYGPAADSGRFDVVHLPFPEIRIVAFLVMPWDTIDTFRTWQPCVRVKNTGALSDSVWVALKFSDTLADRTVYADSHHLLLHGGESDDVSFQSIRFSVPGPYHGQLALRGLRGESETADWDFWVDGNLGVEERSVCADADVTPTIVRSVLFLPVSLFTPHSSLFDMTGRAVMSLRPGENDVSCLSPGVYFVREGQAKTVRKVVLTK